MPPTQLLPKRRGQLAPTYAFARHLAIGVGMDGQRPCRTLAEDPGRTQPRAAYPRAAAQTRVVSLAGIRLRSWESARVFKGIICADVSEIAVGTLITERPPHRSVQAQFGHTACMGVSLSRVHHAIFVVLCSFHSFV